MIVRVFGSLKLFWLYIFIK